LEVYLKNYKKKKYKKICKFSKVIFWGDDIVII